MTRQTIKPFLMAVVSAVAVQGALSVHQGGLPLPHLSKVLARSSVT